MLPPDAVIPFLSSDDPLVRAHAVDYFESAGDVGPLTADSVWAAVDAVGLPAAAASGVVTLLRQLPQSDASTDRLLAAVAATPAADKAVRRTLIEEVLFIDLAQLVRHRDRILALADLPPTTREHLSERLRLTELSDDELWDELLASRTRTRAEQADVDWEDDEDEDDDDYGHKYRVLDALAARGEAAVAARALAVLDDPELRDTDAEDFAVTLLGRVRHRPALAQLVERFAQADEATGDFLLEAMQDAIPRLGGADAVPPIEAAFADGTPDYRVYAAETLGRIKHPAAEAALLRLLADDDATGDEWDNVAHAAMKLCSRDALPTIHRRVVVEDDYDGRIYDLERELVASALITGWTFPELGDLRQECVAREIEDRERFDRGELDDIDDLGGAGDYEDFDDWDDDEPGHGRGLPDNLDDRQPEPTMPIVNQQPKVGRNDPCPCGSGKKYKKCCLKD